MLRASGPQDNLEAFRAFGPSVLEEDDGTLRLWYAGRPPGNVEAAYRLRSADFTRKDEWLAVV